MENKEGANNNNNSNNTASFGLTQHGSSSLPPPRGDLMGPSNLLPSPPDHLVAPPAPARSNQRFSLLMENRTNINNIITTTGLIQHGTGLMQHGREVTNNNNNATTGLIQHGGRFFPRGLLPHPGLFPPAGVFPPLGYPMGPPRPESLNLFPMGQRSTHGAVAVQPSVNADPSFRFTMPVENSSPALKRKRGRPRKYYPEGLLPQSPSPMPISSSVPLMSNFGSQNRERVSGGIKNPQMNPQMFELDISPNADGDSSPRTQVLIVNAGEDVMRKIMEFDQQGSQAICIRSATGPISSVNLREPMSSGGTVTYEGHFEILSLNGSFIPSENGGTRGRAGEMSVSLGRPGCAVFGGQIAGFLIAAGLVMVEIGRFVIGQEESQQLQQQIKKQRREGFGIPATTQVANTSSGGSEEDPNARPVSAPPNLIQPVPVSEPPASFSHGPSTDTVHADYPNDGMMEAPLTSIPRVDEDEDEDDFKAEDGEE